MLILSIKCYIGIICCALREIYLLKVANTIFACVVFLFMIISGISVGNFFKFYSLKFYVNDLNSAANSTYWTGPPSESFHFSTFLPFGMQNTFQGACVMAFAFVDLRKGAYPCKILKLKPPMCSQFSHFQPDSLKATALLL